MIFRSARIASSEDQSLRVSSAVDPANVAALGRLTNDSCARLLMIPKAASFTNARRTKSRLVDEIESGTVGSFAVFAGLPTLSIVAAAAVEAVPLPTPAGALNCPRQML